MNKKLKGLHLCYNCGDDLIKIDEEDIPARNLFVDSTNHGEIIKVPSCRRCNFEFSKTDDYLRDLLGWLNDSETEDKELSRRTIYSLFKYRKVGFKRYDNEGDKHFLRFNVGKLYPSHFKNFKGVFVWETGKVLGQHYKFVIIDNHSDSDIHLEIEQFSQIFEGLNAGVSGSVKVFEYKIAGFTLQLEAIPFDTMRKPDFYAAYMVYHRKIIAIVLASDNEVAITHFKMKDAKYYVKFLQPKV